jgi:lambda repressor-like predicted transcriptional regulator
VKKIFEEIEGKKNESIIYKKIIVNRLKKKGKSIAMLSQYAYTVNIL